MNRQKRDIRGTALLYALGLMMILSIGLTASWRYLITATDQSAHNRHQVEVRRMAESGAYAGLAAIAHDPGMAHIPLSALTNGAYTVDVEQRSGFYTLRITGYLGEAAPWRAVYMLEVDAALDNGQPRVLRWEEAEP